MRCSCLFISFPGFLPILKIMFTFFIAYYLLSDLRFTLYTYPNEPEPITFSIKKSLSDILPNLSIQFEIIKLNYQRIYLNSM